jgi:hypothetical protein
VHREEAQETSVGTGSFELDESHRLVLIIGIIGPFISRIGKVCRGRAVDVCVEDLLQMSIWIKGERDSGSGDEPRPYGLYRLVCLRHKVNVAGWLDMLLLGRARGRVSTYISSPER